MKRATISQVENKLSVRFDFDPALVGLMSELDPRAKFNYGNKAWIFPLETYIFTRLCDLFGMDPSECVQGIGGDAFRMEVMGTQPQPKPVDLSLLDGFRFLTEPYEHQRRGLCELFGNDAWLLGWEMGTGKTKVVCDRINGESKVLILCPKSVLGTWEKELCKHAVAKCTILTGTATQKERAIKTRRPIVVTNYDTLLWWKEPGEWNAVVADECQALRNPTAKRSRKARAIVAPRRWALSGTPAPNSPLDWHGILLFLDPSGRLAGTTSKTAFAARYAIKRSLSNDPKDRRKIIVGYRDLSDLRKRIASCSSRVKKEDCLDLPPKVFAERTCTLEGEQLRVYNTLRRDAVVRLNKMKEESTLTARNVLTEALRLQQIAGGTVPDDLGIVHRFAGNAKLDLFGEILDDLDGKPLVVWCCFREELNILAECLASRGRIVRAIHGGISGPDRQTAIDDFSASRADTFLATIQTGGIGIDGLQRVCDTEVFYSRSYRFDEFAQATDRLHRVGQEKKVTVISLVATGTVDEKIAVALERKEAMQEMMLSRPIEEML